MSQSDRLTAFLEGVDVPAQATTFYASAPLPGIHHTASLPVDGRIHILRKCKDARIVPSSHRPNVLASK